MRVVEEGAIACAYATGMAAIHAALLACDLKAGSTVLASQDLYGATTSLLHSRVYQLWRQDSHRRLQRLVAQCVRRRGSFDPQVMIAETISNPLLKVCDIEACVEIARENGARLIIDNTFASPYLLPAVETRR